jgi:uncharacterized membrane protein
MYMLAQGGAESIIALIIFGVLIINAIAQAIKYVKRQQGAESEGPEQAASDRPAAEGAAPRSDLQRFLEDLSRQAQGTTAQRSTPAPPSAVKQSMKPIQPAQPRQVLEELSRQAQGTTAQGATPMPPSTVKQSMKPIQPAQPRQVPVARPVAAPPRAAPVHHHRKVVRRAPAPIAEDGTQTKGLIIHKHKVRKEMLEVAPPTPEVTSGRESAHSAAERLDERLPKDTLKRAVALRELLGPCRAQSRYRSGHW